MNNKGFAITTILFGLVILFSLLLVAMLGILSSYRTTQEKLINSNNGTKDIITYEKKESEYGKKAEQRGVYCYATSNPSYYCNYYRKDEILKYK